jgi:glycine betaine/proline transport system substrate-binding protein
MFPWGNRGTRTRDTNDDQEQVAKAIAGDKVDPEKAGEDWVKANQDKVDSWLQ